MRRDQREYMRTYGRNRHATIRARALVALGGRCCSCGIDDPRVLQIDHVDGGGYREAQGLRGSTYLEHVITEVGQGSKAYQLLCANCNWIKRAERNETRKVNRLSDAPPREHTGSLFERDR